MNSKKEERKLIKIAIPYYKVELTESSSNKLFSEAHIVHLLDPLDRLALITPIKKGLIEKHLIPKDYIILNPLDSNDLELILNKSIELIYSKEFDEASGFDTGGLKGILKTVLSLFVFGGKGTRVKASPALKARLARDYIENILGGSINSKINILDDKIWWRCYGIEYGGDDPPVAVLFLENNEWEVDNVLSRILMNYKNIVNYIRSLARTDND